MEVAMTENEKKLLDRIIELELKVTEYDILYRDIAGKILMIMTKEKQCKLHHSSP